MTHANSLAAFKALNDSGDFEELRKQVLSLYIDDGQNGGVGLAGFEAVLLMEKKFGKPKGTSDSVRTMISRLKNEGLIAENGNKRNPGTGKPNEICKWTGHWAPVYVPKPKVKRVNKEAAKQELMQILAQHNTSENLDLFVAKYLSD